VSDALIFGFGVFVSLLVAAAIVLLLWGAQQEPEE
jgi:hypothetical protein